MPFWSGGKTGSGIVAAPDSTRAIFGQLPETSHRRIVALRAAIRAYPGTAYICDGPWRLGAEVDLPIRLQALRTIFVTWAQFAYPGVREEARAEAISALRKPLLRLDEGLPDFYRRNIMSSDYAVAAWENNTHAARRAVALVEAIDTLEFPELPFDEGRRYNHFLDTRSLAGPTGNQETQDWRNAQATALGVDCQLLADGTSTADLALAPLWHEPWQAALETNVMAGAGHLNFRKFGSTTEIWLRERKEGALVLGRRPEAAREIIVRVANLPPVFWEREDPLDAIDNFNYSLLGYLDNPNWGSSTRTMSKLEREIRQRP